MWTNVVGAEPLHAKVVDKAMVANTLYISTNASITDIMVDKTQRDRKTITFQSAKF